MPEARTARHAGREQLTEGEHTEVVAARSHTLYHAAVIGLIAFAQLAWLGLLGYEVLHFFV